MYFWHITAAMVKMCKNLQTKFTVHHTCKKKKEKNTTFELNIFNYLGKNTVISQQTNVAAPLRLVLYKYFFFKIFSVMLGYKYVTDTHFLRHSSK